MTSIKQRVIRKLILSNSNLFAFLFLLLSFMPEAIAQTDVSKLIDSLAFNTNDSLKVRQAQKIAWVLRETDWPRALHYIAYAEKLAQKTDDDKLIADNNIKIGDIYNEKDTFDAALSYYLKAYEYYVQNNVGEKRFHLENSLAIIYARLNNQQQAMRHFNNVLKHHTQKNNKLFLAKTLNNIGNLYSSHDDLDSAMIFFKRSLVLGRQLNDHELNITLYNNLGLANAKLGHYTDARNYFNRSRKLMDNESDIKTKAWIFNSLSQLYLLKKEADSALHFSKRAATLLKDAPYSFENKSAINNLYKAYLLKGDYKNAALNFESYDEIRDSLNIEMKAMNVEKLKLGQQYKENEELRMLKESEAKSRYYLIGFGLIIVLLVLGLLLIRYNTKLKHAKLEKDLFEAKQRQMDANLELKDKELMTKSMMEIQRTEIVGQIMDELKQLKLQAPKTETKQTIDMIIKQLDKNKNSDVWKEFELRYGQVYESFYEILNQRHPELTSRDKRLCALLKLNLTTKEIAQVTGQTTKALENARTRLRKKLQLTNTNLDLITYLTNLK